MFVVLAIWLFILGVGVQITVADRTDSFVLGYAAGFPFYSAASLLFGWILS